MSESTAVCVLPHRVDPERPRRRGDGLLVCLGCRSRLTRDLVDLQELDADLVLAHLARRAGAGERVSGSPRSVLPVNVAIADLRAEMEQVLGSWARVVVEDRELVFPTGLHAEAMRSPVTVFAAFLQVHLDWVAGQPFVGDFDGEVRSLRSRAFGLAFPSGRRTFPVGHCPEEGCLGVLTAFIDERALLEFGSQIVCDTDPGHVWPAGLWLQLGRRIHGAA